MHKSVRNKTWRIKDLPNDKIHRLMNKFSITEIQSRLIAAREDKEDYIPHFLDPKLRNLIPDPNHLLDMDKAVQHTIDVIKHKKKICIFGDYDVDGATSSGMLKSFFSSIGVAVEVYIPDRMKEGYGPSAFAMHKIKDNGCELVITVDCGALAHSAIDEANSIDLSVIVIDHHICADALPKAVAIINPNRLDETTEYKYLAAVGVSFLFLVALTSYLRKIGFFTDKPEPNLMDYLDIVALGTVCDVMPLIGLNRAMVKQGLKVMASRKNIGLRVLSDIANISSAPDCYHLGFVLGPRINAGGRVGESHLGSALLSTNSETHAMEIAAKLDEFNKQRRVIEEQIIEEAKNLAALQADNNFIMVSGNWHPGVIGIVAGKLKETYQKPVAVVSLINGTGKASCRSITGIDFGSKLADAKIKGLIDIGGGHAMAAGFTTTDDRLEKLRLFLEEEFGKFPHAIDASKISEYELELTSSAVSTDLCDEIELLAPFGNGNPEPLVKIDGLFVLKAYMVGEKHISCLLASDRNSYKGTAIKAIAFNAAGTEIEKTLLSTVPNTLSVIGTLKMQHRNGDSYPQLIINDLIY